MIFLKNDYGLGAHPQVFAALEKHNLELNDSYGTDVLCQQTAHQVQELTGNPAAEVHFFAGGTLTNLTALAAFLRPFEAAVAAESAHINVHETGAVEATGHKVLTVPTTDGKVAPADIRRVVAAHQDEQMVVPRLVYISDTTEMGAVYTKAELTALHDCCRELGLYLYLDGARLGMALGSAENDLTWQDLAALTDAFYVGGTKCGALFGEMLVILNPALKPHFRYLMRQRGALFAKGMLLGLQFNALLTDGLYEKLGAQADAMGKLLAQGLTAKGYDFAYTPVSNMVFPILSQEKAKELADKIMFEKWLDNPDGSLTARFVTAWNTREEDVRAALALF